MEDVKKLEKSQLIFYFLIARDNLISCKRAMLDKPEDEHLKTIWIEEEKEYNTLLLEIYRRMK